MGVGGVLEMCQMGVGGVSDGQSRGRAYAGTTGSGRYVKKDSVCARGLASAAMHAVHASLYRAPSALSSASPSTISSTSSQ